MDLFQHYVIYLCTNLKLWVTQQENTQNSLDNLSCRGSLEMNATLLGFMS